MRLLLTFVGGRGHFEPLAPIARAASRAGHVVAFGCAPGMAPTVEAAGFAVLRMGAAETSSPKRVPLRAVDREREERDLRERFVRGAARYRVPLALELCERWRPDVVVCDETDFGARLAAERLGIPYATVVVIAPGGFVRAEVVGPALDELRAEHGLPPDPTCESLGRHLVLSPFPPSYRDPRDPLPATAHAFAPRLDDAPTGPPPAWASRLPDAPAIYFTLGTVFNLESGDLFHRVLEGLRELRANVLVTLGPHVDPAELGPQPEHVCLERFVPQATVLPHCDAVVSHGGSGSVMGALAHGLPLVVIPLGADQPQNADRCADLGVARVLDAVSVSAREVRQAVRVVLDEPTYRDNARRLQAEIARLPGADYALRLLERLAAERRPLLAD